MIFHPKAIEMVKFKPSLLSATPKDITPEQAEAKRRRLQEKREAETQAMDEELQGLVELQKGARLVEKPEGVHMWRHLGLQVFPEPLIALKFNRN